jgi:hypothetical protein
MKKKWIVIIVVAVVLIAGYAVYANFFLKRVAVGAPCEDSAMCDGECLGFGDLLPDYSHKEICTRACSAPADCPAGTACEQVQVVSSDGKGTAVEDKRYCLPAGAKK